MKKLLNCTSKNSEKIIYYFPMYIPSIHRGVTPLPLLPLQSPTFEKNSNWTWSYLSAVDLFFSSLQPNPSMFTLKRLAKPFKFLPKHGNFGFLFSKVYSKKLSNSRLGSKMLVLHSKLNGLFKIPLMFLIVLMIISPIRSKDKIIKHWQVINYWQITSRGE